MLPAPHLDLCSPTPTPFAHLRCALPPPLALQAIEALTRYEGVGKDGYHSL